MEAITPQTTFVRRTLEERRFGPDETYARDLLALERFASMRPIGLASSLALSNLISRYPKEADAILMELGVRPFEPFEDERLRSLVSERLQIAELRQRLGRLPFQEHLGLFEY
jgi:hypothetical protein